MYLCLSIYLNTYICLSVYIYIYILLPPQLPHWVNSAMNTCNNTNEGLVDPTRWCMAVGSSSMRRVRGKQPEPKRVRKKGKRKGLRRL